MPWFRRHQSAFMNIGILIGILLIAWAYFNAPVNINHMTAADWQDTHISGIGTATVQKLSAGAPYQSIEDIDRIPGIGPAKAEQIKRHFTTWDTARSETWYIGFIIGLLLFFGCCFVRYIIHQDRKESLKKFEQKIFGNNNEKR